MKSYKKNPDKGGACPPPGGPYCQNPGGNPKDSRIYFGKDAVAASKAPAETPKEEAKAEAPKE